MSILDTVQEHLGQNEINQISQQIGADPAQTQNAIQAALPMMVGGMASTAQQPQGLGNIQQALGSHAGVLGNLGALLGAGPPADGGSILGRVLGQHQQTVQQGVQTASGLNSDQTRRLLMILAPIVLGLLAKRHAQKSQQEIGGALQQEAQAAQQHAQRQSPHIGGLVGKILSYAEQR
jgi:hypothetical protein